MGRNRAVDELDIADMSWVGLIGILAIRDDETSIVEVDRRSRISAVIGRLCKLASQVEGVTLADVGSMHILGVELLD